MEETITSQLQDFLVDEDQDYQSKRKLKDSFWAGEAEKPLFDIYHQWLGTEPTNPIDAEKLLMFSAAKLMEIALIGKLQKMGLVKKQKDDKQMHFLIEREGVPISGYTDGILEYGQPIEVKTFYGDYQARELEKGLPKTSYLKQLAIYMDALDQDAGKLVYLDRGNGAMYEFDLIREPGTLKFKCGVLSFDLNDTYKKWAKLYDENILPGVEPSPYENGLYKADINSLDWSKVGKADISAARNGHKVIGGDRENSWKILYSPYKNLLIERQKQTLGYSDAELKTIRELTKGYSAK